MQYMESKNRALALGLPVILTGLMGGSSTGGRVTTVRALAPLLVADPNLLPTTNPNPTHLCGPDRWELLELCELLCPESPPHTGAELRS
jgi:hypothetical protein